MTGTYVPVLWLHSFVRWAVIGLFAAVLVRAAAGWWRTRPWMPADERTHRALVAVADIQLLLGLWLYVIASPITSAFLADPRTAMKIPALRFFGVEHVAMMVAAMIVLHVGRLRSKRIPEPHRHRCVLRWTTAALVLALLGVPWPFLSYGRPLVRTSMSMSRALSETRRPSARPHVPGRPPGGCGSSARGCG